MDMVGVSRQVPFLPVPFFPTWKEEQRGRPCVDAGGAQDGRGWGHPDIAEPPGLLSPDALCWGNEPRLGPGPWRSGCGHGLACSQHSPSPARAAARSPLSPTGSCPTGPFCPCLRIPQLSRSPSRGPSAATRSALLAFRVLACPPRTRLDGCGEARLSPGWCRRVPPGEAGGLLLRRAVRPDHGVLPGNAALVPRGSLLTL